MDTVAIAEPLFINENKGMCYQFKVALNGEQRKGLAFVSEDYITDVVGVEPVTECRDIAAQSKVADHLCNHIMENKEDFWAKLQHDQLCAFTSGDYTTPDDEQLRNFLTGKGLLPL